MASALLAAQIRADALIIATDVDGVYRDWGTPQQQLIRQGTPAQLSATEFAAGSMGPKVRAACSFVEQTGGFAAIGTLSAVEQLLARSAGTIVYQDPAAVMRSRSR
jgi:carbamate kinase